MKFYCPHPEIKEVVESSECESCVYFETCDYIPNPSQAYAHPHTEAYQEIKALLTEDSIIRKDLEPNNSDLWQVYWGLKWTEYLTLVKVFRATINKQVPRGKEVKEELLGLKNAMDELGKRLDGMSNQIMAHLLVDETGDAFEVCSTLEDSLKKFSNMVSKAVQAIPEDRGGRPQEFYRKQFIKRLARLWQKITSRRPTVSYHPINECSYSPFLKFVQLSCDLAGLPYQSTTSLAQAIKRTLQSSQNC